MGLFGGGGAEDQIRELEEQLDDIQRRQDATRPNVGLPEEAAQGAGGIDLEGRMQLNQSGVKLSPFRAPGAESLDLSSLLKAAQAPVQEPGVPGVPEGQMPGLPGMPGQPGSRRGNEDDELYAVLRQLGGGMQGGGGGQALAGPLG